MGIRSNTYNTVPFMDYMRAGQDTFMPSVNDTLSSGLAEGALNTPTSGLAYNELNAPELATKSVPTGQKIVNPRQQPFVTKALSQEEYAKTNPTGKVYKDAVDLRRDFPKVPYEEGMTRDRASYIEDQMTTTEARQILSQKRPYSYMIANFAGGIPDVTNFIPVFGEAGAGLSMGSKLAAKMIPYARSAADNMVNVAISDTLTYQQREKYGLQVSIMDDIASAALFGVVLHGAGDVLKAGYSKIKNRANYNIEVPDLKPRTPYLEPANIQPADPVAPEPAAVPKEFGSDMLAPYDNYTVNNQKVTTTSKMILNDAIYNVATGKDIELSDAAKGLYDDFYVSGMNNLEEMRYSAAVTPEIKKKQEELYSKIAEVSKLASNRANGNQLSELYNELGKTQAKIKGYRSEVPSYFSSENTDGVGLSHLEQIQYGALPKEVANLFSTEEASHLQELANKVLEPFTDKNPDYVKETSRAKMSIQETLATKLSPLYSGTYGRVYHGTDKIFDNYDPAMQGSNTSADDAKNGIFLSHSHKTASSYLGNAASGANMRMENVKFDNPYVVIGQEHYEAYAFKHFIDRAKELGHDGVIFLDTMDSGPPDTIFIAFSPDQITPALAPTKEVSWSTPQIDYGIMTIKEVVPVIEKILSPNAGEKTKVVVESKNLGYNIEEAGYKLSEEDKLNIDILKKTMTEQEAAAFDKELEDIDKSMMDLEAFDDATDKYAYCRSQR